MPKAYMISNRNRQGDQLGTRVVENPRYFISDAAPNARDTLQNWKQVTQNRFVQLILSETTRFPDLPEEQNEEQCHVSLYVHGYNTSWADAVTRYNHLQKELYSGSDSMGILVLFNWPSDDSVTNYLSDREDARRSAEPLARIFIRLHEQVAKMQQLAARNDNQREICRAKVSVIGHSLGAFVLQHALAIATKRLNNPQLITLVHQLVLVAADIDNDIFQLDMPSNSDGLLMRNVCYRITALYTGLDTVLGASAGLKHFGKRRLGRSGLADSSNVPDNVWGFDVTKQIGTAKPAHSAVFDTSNGRDLLRAVLTGVDRSVIRSRFEE